MSRGEKREPAKLRLGFLGYIIKERCAFIFLKAMRDRRDGMTLGGEQEADEDAVQGDKRAPLQG